MAEAVDVSIITSAHWDGDPRLNRHIRYLQEAGVNTQLIGLASIHPSRLRSVFAALSAVWRAGSRVTILPDPELFVLGSLIARARGSKAVIDIHEDYGLVSASRAWIPNWARPLVRFTAILNDRLGRMVANQTIVAAEELTAPRGKLVANIPDPSDFQTETAPLQQPRVVYVGDVTEPRGALEMARLSALVPGLEVMLIGRVTENLKARMSSLAGAGSELRIVGQVPHDQAWAFARGSLAGLSLLGPFPAYRWAVATKLWEYCASGIPPLVTDLPGQRKFVSQIDPALCCSDLNEVASVLTRLRDDPTWRTGLSIRARDLAIRAWDEARPDKALYEAVVP